MKPDEARELASEVHQLWADISNIVNISGIKVEQVKALITYITNMQLDNERRAEFSQSYRRSSGYLDNRIKLTKALSMVRGLDQLFAHIEIQQGEKNGY